jgi:hypothetical protein
MPELTNLSSVLPHPKSLSQGRGTLHLDYILLAPLLPREKGPGDEAYPNPQAAGSVLHFLSVSTSESPIYPVLKAVSTSTE